ncbi:MAG: hypothetical protein K6F69_02790, partial [Treponema sp.]|nr:hypothetical protein [Treponema sp.]
MSRILGIDVGTNSLGMVVRDDEISKNPTEQIVYSSVNLFKSGVGNGNSGEFSFAAKRTQYRSQRKLYKVRRYRKWATLKLLINNGLCPLSMEDLTKWTTYDKQKGLFREYPTNNPAFNSWIKLDFDQDGKPDYTSPYELRYELATKQLDFDEAINLYKLGRAIYHIAQRRGFKSSKGETIASQENEDANNDDLKQSEIKVSESLSKYITEHNSKTVGCALYELNKNERVRKEYPVIRKMLKNEIETIFNFQEKLNINSDLYKHIISEKKNEGTIFYRNPLKSQKGNVGKCILEPSKPRCPQSRPEFEEFRAWSFINTIRFGEDCKQELNLEDKKELFENIFIRVSDFNFSQIKKWIIKRYNLTAQLSEFNYKDNVKIPSCVVIYRLRELLGENWREWECCTNYKHTSYQNNNKHSVKYTWEDVWHVCFGSDDEECIKTFAEKSGVNYDLMLQLWNSMPIAYSNLSLKAINNINRFLKHGMLYNQACMIAKLPDIFKDKWDDVESIIINSLNTIIEDNAKEKRIVNITNSLIANYKSLEDGDDDKPCNKLNDYRLCDSDFEQIEGFAKEAYGAKTWIEMDESERKYITDNIAEMYQKFFFDPKHQYIKVNRVDEAIVSFLKDNFDYVSDKNLKKLYHHSQIEYYAPVKEECITKGDKIISVKLLKSPVISSIRNPMALRVLHTLRRKINDMLRAGIIHTDDTRIVVEIARELNDANMRWAIKKYQEIKQTENDVLGRILSEIKETYTAEDVRKAKILAEQYQCNPDNDYMNINENVMYHQ